MGRLQLGQVHRLLAGLLAMLATFALGMLIERVFLRRMVGEPIISVIMVTIGLSIFFQAVIKSIFGVWAKPFPEIFPVKSVDVFGLPVQPAYQIGRAHV